jgi:regulator of replication initiation timing
MARSSGAGTGVIVALVVSVVCNLGLLTITFMMYSGKAEALENEARTLADMNAFVTSAERTDAFERVMDAAKAERKSLYSLLESRRQAVSSFVAGNPNAGLADMQSGLGVGESDVVRNVLMDLRREVTSIGNEVSSLERELANARSENDGLRDRLAQAEELGDERVAKVTEEFDGYKTAAVRYEREVEDAVSAIEESRARMDRDYRNRIADLQGRLDQANEDNSVFRSQIEELRRKTESYRVKPQNPAELVDGRVISVPGAGGQVFIDLGRKDRVVPGMTFEIYEDASAIRPDPRTGEYVRGKASLEIIRVGTDTSSARLIREIPGRPVVKDDVIANAVFNPDYRFKFLVHGLFDVNNDGTPSVADADYVRRRVIEWGGELVEGDELTGDLDFLVLGEQPPMPAPLPPDAGDVEFRSFLQQREAREVYDRLFDQASRAQIPVLNWNRFETLTGMTAR